MINDEYTNDELNAEYYQRPISNNLHAGKMNRTSYRTRKRTIYEFEQ